MDAQGLGRRIREERERAHLKQTELASQAGLDRTVLNKIESGVRKVTALELSQIADALGVRMTRLLQDPLPAIVSHRSNQGLDTADSQVDELLSDLAHEVEFVQRLSPDALAPAIGMDEAFEHPPSAEAAESLAERARLAAELEPEAPVLRLPDMVARFGLWAFSTNFGPDTADAGSMLLRSGGVALVNSYHKVGRRRLALAHELGHFLVQDEYTVDWRVSSGASGVESRLDRFARALLLPAAGVAKFWQEQLTRLGTRDAAVLTASRFQVDMTTLARRIDELHLEGDTATVRATQTVQADIIEFGLNVPFDLEGTSLPTQYQRAVLSLYRGQQLSAERALELLRGTVDDGGLPPRRLRVEGELWNFVS